MGATLALLLAAGSGNRLGRQAKGFVELAGIPLFLHSYRAIAGCPQIDGVIVLVPEGYADSAMQWAESVDPGGRLEVRIGGETRVESVRRGLEALTDDADTVLCHDAARPFASADLFGRVLAGLAGFDGVVPVVPSPDTVKRVRGGRVIETVPREELGLVQTPQAFGAEALVEAHRRARRAGMDATDDAMLLEAAGYRVAAVDGDPANFKVTTQEDLRRAELLLVDLQNTPVTPERTR
ncbi:MAG TPA: 2-C-methyl-D-erythritol 4-phosphate cytidylyltransferase [Actinomycetota bacterium]